MGPAEKLKFCRTCQKRKLDPATGIVCSLTDKKPEFEEFCNDYQIDQAEADRLVALERAAVEEEQQGGMFAPEKKGIKKGMLGGIAMMAIAVVWFVVGWYAGYIYYYPPILFCIGLYALIKGTITGNVGGEKK